MMALECDTNARHWGAAVSDGAVVHVFAGKSLEACWTWLSAWFGQARALLVHRSTVGLLPVPVPVNVELVSPPDHQAATVTLENVIEAGELRVVGDAMSEQLRSAKVSGLSSVHKIDQQVSTGPIPVVKAAAWAIWGAVQNPTHAVQIM